MMTRGLGEHGEEAFSPRAEVGWHGDSGEGCGCRLEHLRREHASRCLPCPPKLGVSRQAEHSPQLGAAQPAHSPQYRPIAVSSLDPAPLDPASWAAALASRASPSACRLATRASTRAASQAALRSACFNALASARGAAAGLYKAALF